ncbi:hypothetical protein GJR96_03435 [Haloferax sp. MBLA0076]|uniref:Uncharacterized protein n=1 Tax=Haloferax litoreum TaxID=2666140 RepID=A0A6A8GDW0_9EURY|nr:MULTISPECIES: hypothetical protein [Haloferax]KAB1192540.1 hypothetical protein Hfx1148_03430 [Haloferax sp. CBA1148]MRX21011.1 hypothetical protein [Haloferax litoreum]
MGLTCRLLGHSYGDPETEREREERGDEVVVSIRELQVCSRCGHEQVISENKEVTAIRTPEEVGMTEGEVETAAAGFEPANPKPGTSEASGPDAEAEAPSETDTAPDIETAPDPETEAVADAQSTPDHPAVDETVEADEAPEEAEPPVTDDAIILDDEHDDEAQRDRTQWPDEVSDVDTDESAPAPAPDGDDAEFIDADAEADTAGDAPKPTREHGAWPEAPGEDEGWDAKPDDGEPASVSFGGGLTPEVNGSVNPASNGEYVEADDADEFVRAEETNLEAPDQAIEYYCPNCGHSRAASASSMRAGDICPECKKGYIAEREA